MKITNHDGSEVYKDFPVDRLEFKRRPQEEKAAENGNGSDKAACAGKCKKCKKHGKNKSGGQDNRADGDADGANGGADSDYDGELSEELEKTPD
ncbi:MAG: hypothetical protein SOT08_06430 [Candidatus Borkfalkiaceae bacterium]|nr:hypothetical protein [Christensenellaceae bacterium]